MSEAEQRESIVACARTWLRTPWHHAARVRGAGVDCVQFVNCVYHEALGTPLVDVDYTPDQYLHHGQEVLLEYLSRLSRPVHAALPGDVVVYRFGRAMSHAGIVVRWPEIIHASRPDAAVVLADGEGGYLADRERGVYRWTGFRE
ncbi:C40 family peptidase [Paraburkholderia sp. J11-2]|uniref:C40 family peptidase n=1 Tax=Paraburkholderia sp. J11-2 TaxID=2805431 RepID=UPI002AB71879|nr:NlpC/P60 family protein [Paraburkholderia sp. J11-2]